MRVLLLGPVVVGRTGAALSDLDRRRHRELVAILALRRERPVSIAEISELLWSGEPPPTATDTIAGYVSLVRRVLGSEALATSRGRGYQLVGSPMIVDLDEVDQLNAEGTRNSTGETDAARHTAVEHWNAALTKFRGPVLGDIGDADWAIPTVVRYEDLRSSLTERIIDQRLQWGEHRLLVGELEALCREHPLREHFAGQLMLALYRSGRQADALRAFGRTKSALIEQLGVSPSQPLQAIEAAILRQDPSIDQAPTRPSARSSTPSAQAAAPDRPASVPLRTAKGTFVGRETETSVLEAAFAAVGPNLGTTITLAGPAGIGKSRTVVEFASNVIERTTRAPAGRADKIDDHTLMIAVRCLPGSGVLQPFVDAARIMWERVPAVAHRDLVGIHAQALATLLPDLAPAIATAAGGISSELVGYRTRLAELDADYARQAFISALTTLFRVAAADSKTLLVVDDVHLADQASTALLAQQTTRPIPNLMMVLTLREDDLAGPTRIATQLRGAAANGNGRIIDLDGLGTGDVEHLARSLSSTIDVETLHRRSGGNPFICLQLLHTADGVDLPSGVVEFVRLLVERLTGGSDTVLADVLRVASLIGPSFPIDVLLECMAPNDSAVLDALDRLADGGLVEDDAAHPGWLCFVPEVVRDVLLAQMTPTRRRLGHRRVADGWSTAKLHDTRLVTRNVARHLHDAGPLADFDWLATAAESAARDAVETAAFEDAIGFATSGLRALDVLEGSSDRTEFTQRRIDLLLILATAFESTGDHDAAQAHAHAALEASRQDGRAVLVCRSINQVLYGSGIMAKHGMESYLEEAEAIIGAHSNGLIPSDVLAQHLTDRMYWACLDNPDLVQRLATTALDLADHVDDVAVRVGLLQAVAETTPAFDTAQFDDLTDRCEALAAPHPGHMGLWRDVLHLRTTQALRDGDLAAYRAYVAQHAQISVAARRHRGLAASSQKRAILAHLDGDLPKSEALIAEMIGHDPNPDFSIGFLAQTLLIRRDQGRLHEALPLAASLLGEHATRIELCGAALAFGAGGDPHRSKAALRRLNPATASTMIRHPGGLFLLCCAGEAAAIVNDESAARSLLSVIESCIGRHGSAMTLATIGPVSRVVGLLQCATGFDGRTALHAAIAQSMGGLQRARALLDWAEAERRGSGTTKAVQDAVGEARLLVHQTDATGLAVRAASF